MSTSNDFRDILAEVKATLSEEAQGLRDEFLRLERAETRLTASLSAAEEAASGASAEDRELLESRRDQVARDLASIKSTRERLNEQASALEARASAPDARETLTEDLSSYLLHINGGTLKLVEIDTTRARGEVIVPLESMNEATRGQWSIDRLDTPESSAQAQGQ